MPISNTPLSHEEVCALMGMPSYVDTPHEGPFYDEALIPPSTVEGLVYEALDIGGLTIRRYGVCANAPQGERIGGVPYMGMAAFPFHNHCGIFLLGGISDKGYVGGDHDGSLLGGVVAVYPLDATLWYRDSSTYAFVYATVEEYLEYCLAQEQGLDTDDLEVIIDAASLVDVVTFAPGEAAYVEVL